LARPPVIKLSSPATQEFWEIPILFEDDHLLALDKPRGLLASPDRYDPHRPNLMRLLHHGIRDGKPWAATRKLDYLMNAHRLDFETSGVMLLAKAKPVLVALANLFSIDKPVKKYAALVWGHPASDQFEIDAPIGPHPSRLGEMRVTAKDGKESRTLFEVRERFVSHALLACQPVTGRTHQIRVHLRHARLPIVGDSVYGGRPLLLSHLKRDYRLKPGATERPLMAQTALHAEELTLFHPVTAQETRITAPWPKDLSVAVKYLRRYSGPAGATGPAGPAGAAIDDTDEPGSES